MLRAAIVGLGWWGKHIVGSLGESDKIDIIRAVDINAEGMRDFADQNRLMLSGDFQDALDDEAVELVILATPHSLHEDQIVRVAAAEKHVFCEKPLCLTAASAKRAIDACSVAGVQLGIGHERRFEPAMVEIQRMIAADELGTIMHAESNFSHDKLANVPLTDWRTSSAEAPAAGMTGMGIHLTDAYLNMLGPVSEVFAQTAKRVLTWENGDVVSVQLRFESGATGYLSAILVTPLFLRYQVFGSDAWAEARNPTHPDTPGESFLTVCRAGGQPETRRFEWIDSVRANFESFADSITEGTPYAFSSEQKLHNIEIFEAICRSVTGGTPVRVTG
jgi:predicted dehydrogenase